MPPALSGDGAVGVHAHGDAHRGQHGHRGDADAVELGRAVGHPDGDGDDYHGKRDALQAHRQSVDDVGGVAGAAGLGDALHRLGRGVVLGDEADEDASQRAREHGPEDADGDAVGEDQHQRRHQEQHRGQDRGASQCRLRIDLLEDVHGIDADHRRDEPQHGQDQRQRHQGGAGRFGPGREQSREPRGSDGAGNGDGRDHRADVGLEQVGAHAGHVAHVVAHVVRDDAGVARVVLGNARLDLAHQVRAHVRGLGVDAAADTGEQRDGAGAHGKAADVLGVVGVAVEEIQDAHAQKAETGHRKTHHRAAVEGHEERFGLTAFRGRLGRAHVGAGGRLHAEKAGDDRADGAGEERQRGVDSELPCQQQRHHHHEDGKNDVLALQEGHGSFVDGVADGLHARVLDSDLDDAPIRRVRDDQSHRAQYRGPNR